MAQSMASMAGLRGSSNPTLEGILRSSRTTKIGFARPGFRLRALAQQSSAEAETTRRALMGLVAAGVGSGSLVRSALAEAKPIKIGPPPPPSGGLPGTLNSDEARDFKLPLKERFYLQPKPPAEAAARAKELAKEIIAVKAQIDNKAWPYVQNDLRLRAGYLRYDLNTVISSKPKAEKQALKDLSAKLFKNISDLDHAAKIKSTPEAEKYYAETVSTLNELLSKIG